MKTERPREPENRITIRNVVEHQNMRAVHDEFAKDPRHMLNHIIKAAGYTAAWLDKMDHGEEVDDVLLEDKRDADLIISAIWLVAAKGKDPAALVANRIWDLGIMPKREELPGGERRLVGFQVQPDTADSRPIIIGSERPKPRRLSMQWEPTCKGCGSPDCCRIDQALRDTMHKKHGLGKRAPIRESTHPCDLYYVEEM